MPNTKLFPDSVVPLPASGVSSAGMVVNAAEPAHLDEQLTLHSWPCPSRSATRWRRASRGVT